MKRKLSENELRIQKIVENHMVDFMLSDDETEIIFWEKLFDFEKKDPDFEIIKSKTLNLLKMYDAAYKAGGEIYEMFLNRDFEEDVWFQI